MTNTKNLFHKSVYLFWWNIGQNSPSTSKSDCHNFLEMGIQLDGWENKEKIRDYNNFQ